ncbi:hypothetical protein [Tsukamurella hominis]|uniref:hypothetical protein n=1 Tax=Tsukamurella hominis TaxID=1970232 RepID=UPI0039ED478E
MTATTSSAEQRAHADYELYGTTAEARKISARILVKLARQEDKDPDQWVLDVAEGRLPA